MAVRRIVTSRAKNNIRNLYWRSTRKNIQRKQETKSLVNAMIELVYTTPLIPSKENQGILSIWKSKGYTIFESTHCFARKASGIICKPIGSKQNMKRKWYFACVVDINMNTLYIVNAAFAKYIDRTIDNTPSAIKFINAMKGVYTRKNKKESERRQLSILFPESKINQQKQQYIISECIDKYLKKYKYRYSS